MSDYEDYEDYEDNEREEDDNFTFEAKAFERTSYMGKLQQLIPVQGRKNEISPQDRFYLNINSKANELYANFPGTFHFPQNEIDEILITNAEKLSHREYINPMGFILGSQVLDKGRISKTKVQKIFKFLQDNDMYEKEYLQPADIIRYGRLWESLISS